MKSGKVYLVGAGPGDPGLLTIKARDLIEMADCIIYDNLVNKEILRYASSDCELIYAGKDHTKSSPTQENINRIMVAKAAEHNIVVRLKGGDPFVFGRGGEELQALISASIECEVVPGISSGIAVPAYAGIPVTHRGLSRSVAFVTAHEDTSNTSSSINWGKLATSVDTLVIFMGACKIREIVEKLIYNGCSADTPIAIIQHGTYQNQVTTITTLRDASSLHGKIQPPSIIVIGEVATLDLTQRQGKLGVESGKLKVKEYI